MSAITVERDVPGQPSLESAERRVEARAAALPREMGLRDVVLAQVLIVLGVTGLATAARAGAAQTMLWLLAIVTFYLPLGAVVVHLNRRVPLEGGIYQWARLGLGELAGFIVAWNTWLFVVLNTSGIGLSAATAMAYAAGPRWAWVAESRWVIAAAGCALIGGMVALAVVGLGVSKWVHNAGSAILLAIFAALILLPFVRRLRDPAAPLPALSLTMPALTLANLALFARIAGYSLGGLEYVAIFAGECREPARVIGRAVLLAAPLVAALCILGTASVLAFVRPERVDMINPVAQVFTAGFGGFGVVAYVAPLAIVLLLLRDVAQTNFAFAGGTRLPMVAGWDRLLPEWFTRLDPRWRMPVNSIVFAGAASAAMALASLVGVGAQEAYQLLLASSGIFVVSGYLALFAIPLVGFRGQGLRLPAWVRLASVSGLLVAALFVTLSIFPIIEVESWRSYAAKVGGVVAAAEVLGVAVFLTARRRAPAAE